MARTERVPDEIRRQRWPHRLSGRCRQHQRAVLGKMWHQIVNERSRIVHVLDHLADEDQIKWTSTSHGVGAEYLVSHSRRQLPGTTCRCGGRVEALGVPSEQAAGDVDAEAETASHVGEADDRTAAKRHELIENRLYAGKLLDIYVDCTIESRIVGPRMAVEAPVDCDRCTPAAPRSHNDVAVQAETGLHDLLLHRFVTTHRAKGMG